MKSLRLLIALLLWSKDNLHPKTVLQVSHPILMSLDYQVWHVKSITLGEGTIYTEQTDILRSSRVISPPFRRAETVKLICVSRFSQRKCFSLILFSIANFGQILMSYSEDWITRLIYCKTCILYKNKFTI